MELNRNSVVKKALLENLRLTGKAEAGDWEAEATVRVTDNAAGDTVMNRTLYLNDKMLKHMVPGKYIDISVVRDPNRRFRFPVPGFLFPGQPQVFQQRFFDHAVSAKLHALFIGCLLYTSING